MWLLGDSECVQQNVSQGCKHDSAAGLSSDQIIFLTLQTLTPPPSSLPFFPHLPQKKKKWSNTIKQFVGCHQRIFSVCLTIFWGWI